MKHYIRLRDQSLLAITLAALLSLFSACSEPEVESSVSDEPDSSFEADFDTLEELENIPEYASVKEVIDAQNWELAGKKLTSLLKQADPHPAFANDLGFVLMQQEQWKAASKAFNQAIHLDPKYERAFYNLGICYRKLNDLEAAESAYRSAVAINPYYNEAWFNLGLLLYAKNALEEAKQAFLQITENTRTSRFSRAFYQLGLIASREGNDAEAIDFYDQSILLTPSHVPTYLNKGAALLRLDLLEKAHETLARAQALAPEDSLVLWNLGLVAFKQSNFEEAHNLFHRVAYANNEPPNAEAHYMLGKTYSEKGELNAAINEYEFALKIRPDYPEAAFNLALNLDRSGDKAAAIAIYQKLAESENASAESLNNLATYHLEEGKDAAAIPMLERATQIDPTYSTGYYNLGLAELRLEHFDKAADAFSQATKLEPSNFAAWKNLGISYARNEKIESALEAMQQAHLLDPADADTAVYVVKYLKLLDRPDEDITKVYRLSYEHGARNPLILRHLARDAFAREDYESAVNFYQEYIKLRPTPAYYFSLGLSLRKMNRFEEAKAAYLEAVKLRPSYSKAWLNLGYIHAFLGDLDAARSAFEKATKLEPSNFATWKNLGISYARNEKIESALEAMQQAHLLDPADADTAVYVVKYLKLLDRPDEDITKVYRLSYEHGARNPLILRHLARDAFAREDYESAVNFYQEYIKLRPTPAYYFSLGLSLRKMNRFEEAKAAYLEAVKLRPTYSKAWLNLGYIHAFLGDLDAARSAFEKALELEPNYTNAIDAIRELEAGEIHP